MPPRATFQTKDEKYIPAGHNHPEPIQFPAGSWQCMARAGHRGRCGRRVKTGPGAQAFAFCGTIGHLEQVEDILEALASSSESEDSDPSPDPSPDPSSDSSSDPTPAPAPAPGPGPCPSSSSSPSPSPPATPPSAPHCAHLDSKLNPCLNARLGDSPFCAIHQESPGKRPRESSSDESEPPSPKKIKLNGPGSDFVDLIKTGRIPIEVARMVIAHMSADSQFELICLDPVNFGLGSDLDPFDVDATRFLDYQEEYEGVDDPPQPPGVPLLYHAIISGYPASIVDRILLSYSGRFNKKEASRQAREAKRRADAAARGETLPPIRQWVDRIIDGVWGPVATPYHPPLHFALRFGRAEIVDCLIHRRGTGPGEPGQRASWFLRMSPNGFSWDTPSRRAYAVPLEYRYGCGHSAYPHFECYHDNIVRNAGQHDETYCRGPLTHAILEAISHMSISSDIEKAALVLINAGCPLMSPVPWLQSVGGVPPTPAQVAAAGREDNTPMSHKFWRLLSKAGQAGWYDLLRAVLDPIYALPILDPLRIHAKAQMYDNLFQPAIIWAHRHTGETEFIDWILNPSRIDLAPLGDDHILLALAAGSPEIAGAILQAQLNQNIIGATLLVHSRFLLAACKDDNLPWTRVLLDISQDPIARSFFPDDHSDAIRLGVPRRMLSHAIGGANATVKMVLQKPGVGAYFYPETLNQAVTAAVEAPLRDIATWDDNMDTLRVVLDSGYFDLNFASYSGGWRLYFPDQRAAEALDAAPIPPGTEIVPLDFCLASLFDADGNIMPSAVEVASMLISRGADPALVHDDAQKLIASHYKEDDGDDISFPADTSAQQILGDHLLDDIKDRAWLICYLAMNRTSDKPPRP